MQIDIASHIEKLLFLHDNLAIPGLGGLTAAPVPASVDYAGGTVAPPSKTLTFNENLAIDDGILAEDIAKIHGISTAEAQTAIRQYVDNIQAQLNQREIVTIQGVGRLYKNYVQKIQFLPDATNFNAGSYGLPPLQFSPIARSREVAEKPAATPATNGATPVATAPPAPAPEPAKAAAAPVLPPLPPTPAFINDPYTAPRSSSARLGTGIGIGLLLCTIAFGIWWWQNKKTRQADQATAELLKDDATPATNPVPGVADLNKIAAKPKKETPATEPAPAEKDEDLGDEVEEAAAQKVEVLRRQNEAPPAKPSAEKPAKRLCILVIATLSDVNNADRLVAKLKGAGYDVYYRETKGYQIGIQFTYSDPKEIQQQKTALEEFTGEKGIIVKQK